MFIIFEEYSTTKEILGPVAINAYDIMRIEKVNENFSMIYFYEGKGDNIFVQKSVREIVEIVEKYY